MDVWNDFFLVKGHPSNIYFAENANHPPDDLCRRPCRKGF